VAWLTGLFSSGKTALALGAERALYEEGLPGGDELRRGLKQRPGFSMADGGEGIRRIAQKVRLHAETGVVVLVAAISPTHAIRDGAAPRALLRFAPPAA